MLKKNDLIITVDHHVYRVLAIRGEDLLVIDCVKRKMPKWIRKPGESCVRQSETIYKVLGEEPVTVSGVSIKRRSIAYQRFSMIAGIVAVIDDKNKYTKMINDAAEEFKVSRQSIRKYLCNYLV